MLRVPRSALVSFAVAAAVIGGVVVVSANGGQSITKGEAIAFGRAVNLGPSDLPGSSQFVGEGGSRAEGAKIERPLRCGGSHVRPVAGEASLLENRYRDSIGEVVGSTVSVMPSEKAARAVLATLGSRTGRSCLTSDFRSHFGTRGPDRPIYEISITSAPVTHILGRDAVALHLLAQLQRPPRVESHRGQPPESPAKLVYWVEAVFRVGAADIAFYTLSEQRRFPQDTENRLLTLLHERAETHKL